MAAERGRGRVEGGLFRRVGPLGDGEARLESGDLLLVERDVLQLVSVEDGEGRREGLAEDLAPVAPDQHESIRCTAPERAAELVDGRLAQPVSALSLLEPALARQVFLAPELDELLEGVRLPSIGVRRTAAVRLDAQLPVLRRRRE